MPGLAEFGPHQDLGPGAGADEARQTVPVGLVDRAGLVSTTATARGATSWARSVATAARPLVPYTWSRTC